ncbi:MAG TPA: polymorphic toxin-type HINT domain-containing protein [Pirellulales bacterium]|nr:polymorphic toxin-type HINT domain-containing protein [Pirellulales bacterium]
MREALIAELAGDDTRRDALLAHALQEDPECRAARWQAGYSELEGKWFTPEEVAGKYASDPKLSEYRRRRDHAADAGLFSRVPISDIAESSAGGPTAGGGWSASVAGTTALSSEGLAALVELARWCRAKRLPDEARAHWLQVLVEAPRDGEAERRLGMRWFRGTLVTNAQIEEIKKQHSLEENQLALWKPIVIGWRKSLDEGTAAAKAQATAEMKTVRDPGIIPALEWADATDAVKPPSNRDAATPFQQQAIALLGHLPPQRATYSLVEHAVMARQSEVRSAATDQLKARSLYDFVPILLAGLANPIEFDYATSFDHNLGLSASRAVVSQEGPDAIRQVEYSDSTSGLRPTFVGGLHTVVSGTEWIDVAHIKITPKQLVRYVVSGQNPSNLAGAVTTRQINSISQSSSGAFLPSSPGSSDRVEADRAVVTSERFAASVDARNARIELTDQRIDSVLKEVTKGMSAKVDENADEKDAIPDTAVTKPSTTTADYWWNWWATYNEAYSPEKPTSITAYSRGYNCSHDVNTSTYNVDMTPQMYNSVTRQLIRVGRTHSCFAAGTPVTAITGRMPIEKLRIGDRVLAQDADSGELAYKPVLGTTVRPPIEMMLVTTTRGALRTTRGHPFWIVGKGWRMAKELQVGDRVHCLDGSATVTAIAAEPPQSAYNLIVADFGTYFVGDGRILVHDNTPRLPTAAKVPGFVAMDR